MSLLSGFVKQHRAHSRNQHRQQLGKRAFRGEAVKTWDRHLASIKNSEKNGCSIGASPTFHSLGVSSTRI